MKIDLQINVNAYSVFNYINLKDEVEYALCDYLEYGELEDHDKLNEMEWEDLIKRMTYDESDLVFENFIYEKDGGDIVFRLPITIKLDE